MPILSTTITPTTPQNAPSHSQNHNYLHVPYNVFFQTPNAIGKTGPGDTWSLVSTVGSPRGKIYFGAAAKSAYDEVNERFGIGTNAPSYDLHVYRVASPSSEVQVAVENAGSDGGITHMGANFRLRAANFVNADWQMATGYSHIAAGSTFMIVNTTTLARIELATDGTVAILGSLNVGGFIAVTGNLVVASSAFISTNLSVSGSGNISGNLTVSNNLYISSLPSVAQLATDGSGRIIAGAAAPSAQVFFNVRDYGAVGDGITNDIGAMAACQAAALTVRGGCIYWPPGTYLHNAYAQFIVPQLFSSGAVIKPAAGITLEFHDHIMAPHDRQIFNLDAAGSALVFTAPVCDWAYTAWVGATGAGGNDAARVNKLFAAVQTGGQGIYFNASCSITTPIIPSAFVSIDCLPGVHVATAAPVSGAFWFRGDQLVGTPRGSGAMVYHLPDLFGDAYHSVAGSLGIMIGNGINLIDLTCGLIHNFSTGVYFTTSSLPAAGNVLNNRFKFNQINGCTDGFNMVRTGAGDPAMQGNEIHVEFLIDFHRYGMLWNAPGISAGPMDTWIFKFNTIDTLASNPSTGAPINPDAIVAINNAADGVWHSTIRVESWFGGFGLNQHIWYGNFYNCEFYWGWIGGGAPLLYDTWTGQGNSNMIRGTGSAYSSGSIVAATAPGSRGVFNGGVPFWETKMLVAFNPAVAIPNNSNYTWYVYSPYSDLNSVYVHLWPRGSYGMFVVSIAATANPNEIAIVMRNASGGVINAPGEVWYVDFGQD